MSRSGGAQVGAALTALHSWLTTVRSAARGAGEVLAKTLKMLARYLCFEAGASFKSRMIDGAEGKGRQ
jgi:hypothetical protein